MTDHDRELPAGCSVGCVVVLLSGGPRMTVTHLCGASALCQWFDGYTPMMRMYPLAALNIAPLEEPS